MSIPKLKKEAMDMCKANEHRMTRYSDIPVTRWSPAHFSAICKDCYMEIKVYPDAQIQGTAHHMECRPDLRHLDNPLNR